MIVSIHQPNYLPYLGYFDKIYKSDVFVIYDTANFVKEMFYNRNKIKTSQGEKWLTIPVLYKFHNQTKIKDIPIDNSSNWMKKHWQTIIQNYSKSHHFEEVKNLFEPIYSKEWVLMSEFSFEIISTICRYLKIETKLILSSTLDVKDNEDRTQKLLTICKELNATSYLSGETGNKYLKETEFEKIEISVIYQKYIHPIYNQLHGDFSKNMCVLDLLFNHGKESTDILINK